MGTQWKDQQWAEVHVALEALAKLKHSGVESCLPSWRGWSTSVNGIWERSMK